MNESNKKKWIELEQIVAEEEDGLDFWWMFHDASV